MSKPKKATNESMLKAVVSLGEQVRAVKSELVTKIDDKVEAAKEEILKEVRPIAKAIDKDAVTIVEHEKRLTRIGAHLALK